MVRAACIGAPGDQAQPRSASPALRAYPRQTGRGARLYRLRLCCAQPDQCELVSARGTASQSRNRAGRPTVAHDQITMDGEIMLARTPRAVLSKQKRTKINKDRRAHMVRVVAAVLATGEPTYFAFEATCRHAIRSR